MVFEDNTKIESMTIPDDVVSPGKGTFKGCSGLKKLSMPISLDATVDKNAPAFEGCCGITDFVFTKGTGKGLEFHDSDGKTGLTASVDELGGYTFTKDKKKMVKQTNV